MTTTGIAKILKDIQTAQMQSSLADLSHAEHVAALTDVIFSLHPETQNLFARRLQEERAKHQKQREALEKLLAIPDPTSGQVH